MSHIWECLRLGERPELIGHVFMRGVQMFRHPFLRVERLVTDGAVDVVVSLVYTGDVLLEVTLSAEALRAELALKVLLFRGHVLTFLKGNVAIYVKSLRTRTRIINLLGAR